MGRNHFEHTVLVEHTGTTFTEDGVTGSEDILSGKLFHVDFCDVHVERRHCGRGLEFSGKGLEFIGKGLGWELELQGRGNTWCSG